MTKASDPLGKRALFSGAPADPQSNKPGPLDITVLCSSCKTTTTLSAPQFFLHHLPVWAWIPGRDYALLMRCPACDRRAWLAVSRAR